MQSDQKIPGQRSKSSLAGWREFLLVAGPALLLIAITVWATSRYVAPAPPNKIVIAAASKGSPYYRWAEQYQKVLAQSGITLEIKETSGSSENLPCSMTARPAFNSRSGKAASRARVTARNCAR